MFLHMKRLHARWTGESWWDTSHALFFALWNLNPETGIRYRITAQIDKS